MKTFSIKVSDVFFAAAGAGFEDALPVLGLLLFVVVGGAVVIGCDAGTNYVVRFFRDQPGHLTGWRWFLARLVGEINRPGIKKRLFLIASALVGLEACGWELDLHRFLIASALFAVVCFWFLRELHFGRQFLWMVTGAVVTMALPLTPLTVFICAGGFRSRRLDSWWLDSVESQLLWIPWICLFAAAVLSFQRWGLRSRLVYRPLIAAGLAAALYVFSSLLCLDFWTVTPTADEPPKDERGREPVIGPGVTLVGRAVCKVRDPEYIMDDEYEGDESIFVVYRPLIRLWFWLHRERYYYPYTNGVWHERGDGAVYPWD